MENSGGVKMSLEGLEKVQKSLSALSRNREVQVGIFGSKAGRKKGDVTNSEIGFVHEMGSVLRNIPRRSFLVDTFRKKGKDLTSVLHADLMIMLRTGVIERYLERVGIEAVNLVREAFFTSGWGSWAPLSYGTLLGKLTGASGSKGGPLSERQQRAAEVLHEGAQHTKPLIDSGQLWQAVGWRVAKS